MLKHVLVLDLESYYDRQECTLKKLSTPEYIFHPRFAVHLLAAYDMEWDAPRIIEAQDIPSFLEQYPAAETISVSHNSLFDSAILAWKYGWVAGRMADTLGMVRALRGYQRNSLGAVAKELFGYDPKGDVIGKVAGMNIQGIKNAGLWGEYRTYAMNDAKICANIYLKLLPEFPAEEQKIMDLVLRAAVVPKLHANVSLLQSHLESLRRRKLQLLRDCGYERAALMSMQQFQVALESLGVEVQTKVSPTGRNIPMFAKTDKFMQDLLEYDQSDDEDTNLQVQALAAARLSFKSTLEETRAEKFLNIASLPWGNGPLLPGALRYGGAHTHRLSGEWSLNLQNLPRDKAKSKLRHALCAPPGCKLVTCDLSQIEARIVAVLAKEDALVEAFRRGEDVYAQFASVVFSRPVTDKKSLERFVGKTAILGLGYGCGFQRFYQMVVTSARTMGIELEGRFNLEMAEKIVGIYRNLFPRIQNTWRMLDQALANYINSENKDQEREWGPVIIKSGTIILPNDMTLRYERNDDKLYGAKLLENVTQALARVVLMQAALRLSRKGYRFALQCHDELLFVVPEERVDAAKKTILEEMTRPPDWMPELPLAAEIGVGGNYGETK